MLLNTATGSIESEFHMFVQPSENPRLSGFCTELTGITQVSMESLPLVSVHHHDSVTIIWMRHTIVISSSWWGILYCTLCCHLWWEKTLLNFTCQTCYSSKLEVSNKFILDMSSTTSCLIQCYSFVVYTGSSGWWCTNRYMPSHVLKVVTETEAGVWNSIPLWAWSE